MTRIFAYIVVDLIFALAALSGLLIGIAILASAADV